MAHVGQKITLGPGGGFSGFFGAQKFRLGSPALRDVMVETVSLSGHPRSIKLDAVTDICITHNAIFAVGAIFHFIFEGFLRRQGVLDVPFHNGPVRGMTETFQKSVSPDRLTALFLNRGAQQPP